MRKEIFKNITLTVLICSGLLMFCQIWFSEKLWSPDYNFFAVVGDFFNIKPSDILKTGGSISVDNIITPKRFVVTGNGKRCIISKGTEEYDKFCTKIEKISESQAPNSTKSSLATESEWTSGLKSKSILLDYGSVYSYELISGLSIFSPPGAVKEVLITPGDAIVTKPYIYIKDSVSGDIYKFVSNVDDNTVIDLIANYVSGETAKNNPFAFELGFDKTVGDTPSGGFQNIFYDSNIIVGLTDETISNIQVDTPDNIVNNIQFTDNILKLFKFNKSTTRRYIEKDDAIAYVDKMATLKINPKGYIEYSSEAGGFPIFDESTESKKVIPESVSNIYSIMRNVMRYSGIGEPAFQMSSDLYGLTKSNFTTNINIDYFINANPVMMIAGNDVIHPVELTVTNGKLVHFKMYILKTAPQSSNLTLKAMYKAVDNLEPMAQDKKEIIISDIYPAYIIDENNNTSVSWCSKIKGDNEIAIIRNTN